MIPAVIHRIWFGSEEPAEFVDNRDAWRALHPKWHVVGWGDGRLPSEILPLVRGLLHDAHRLCPGDELRFKADVLRLELLRLYGGVYVDADVTPLRPIDPLREHACFVGYSPNRGKGGERLLTNAIIGAERGHPFIMTCIAALPQAIRQHAGKPLAQMIGPHHLSRMARTYPDSSVALLDEQVLYPRSGSEEASAYTRHAWAHSRGKKEAW